MELCTEGFIARKRAPTNQTGFWDNDALTNIEGVLEVILEALASPAPHPDPLPDGERERTAETDK